MNLSRSSLIYEYTGVFIEDLNRSSKHKVDAVNEAPAKQFTRVMWLGINYLLKEGLLKGYAGTALHCMSKCAAVGYPTVLRAFYGSAI